MIQGEVAVSAVVALQVSRGGPLVKRKLSAGHHNGMSPEIDRSASKVIAIAAATSEAVLIQ
jgi:hypothetical protein